MRRPLETTNSMHIKKLIAKLNDRLGSELGRTFDGQPLYKWIWSEDPVLMHAMRVPGEYDYRANEAGLIVAHPVYETRKLAQNCDKQWIWCHWIDTCSEAEWRANFGYALEWPRNGQYVPTNVILDPGEEPNESVNQMAIWCCRESRKKSGAQLERELMAAADKREAEASENQYQDILNDLPTYPSIPGSKGMVSYPSVNPPADAG